MDVREDIRELGPNGFTPLLSYLALSEIVMPYRAVCAIIRGVTAWRVPGIDSNTFPRNALNVASDALKNQRLILRRYTRHAQTMPGSKVLRPICGQFPSTF